MTLTNICLLALCVCALWMLEEAAQAESVALPANRVPADLKPDAGYMSTIPPTLLRSLLGSDAGDAETPLAADIQGGPLYDDYSQVPPPEQPFDFGSAISEGLTGLMTPYHGIGASQTIDDIGISESAGSRINLFNNLPDSGFILRAGPLALDLYAITFAALYADRTFGGAPPAGENGFIASISLRGALKVELGESGALAVGFTVYYLPTVNRVGVYFSNVGAGLGAGATLGYETRIGGWDVVIGDRLGTAYPLGDLLREYEPNALVETDNYQFGRGGSLGNRAIVAEELYYSNNAYISASTQLDEYWKFRAGIGRLDFWSTSLSSAADKPLNSRYTAEAGLSYDSPDTWFRPWFRYNYLAFADLKGAAHSVRAGATLPLTPTLTAFVNGGWLFLDTNGPSIRGVTNTEHYIAEAGFVHQINESLSHSLLMGHNYTVTDYGEDFLGTYWRYRAFYSPSGSRWSFAANVQEDQNDLSRVRGLTYAGRVYCTLNDTTSLRLVGTQTRYTGTLVTYDRWLLGAYVTHVFGPTISGSIGCHYSQYRTSQSSANFNERVISATLTKTL